MHAELTVEIPAVPPVEWAVGAFAELAAILKADGEPIALSEYQDFDFDWSCTVGGADAKLTPKTDAGGADVPWEKKLVLSAKSPAGCYVARVAVREKGHAETLCEATAAARVEFPALAYDVTRIPAGPDITEGDDLRLTAACGGPALPTEGSYHARWEADEGEVSSSGGGGASPATCYWSSEGVRPRVHTVRFVVRDDGGNLLGSWSCDPVRVKQRGVLRGDILPVTLKRTQVEATPDQALWVAIRNRARAISFPEYRKYVDSVMCGTDPEGRDRDNPMGPGRGASRPLDRFLPFPGVDAYALLKAATEAFLMHECGIAPGGGEEGIDLPVTPPAPSRPSAPSPPLNLKVKGGTAQVREEAPPSIPIPTHPADRWKLIPPSPMAADALNAIRFNRPVTTPEIARMRERYLERLQTESGSFQALPYFSVIRDRLREVPLKGPGEVPPNCYGILKSKLTGPCFLELLWSYWHEEGGLVQTMNAIGLRFQNMRGRSSHDPLAHLDIDPLRPLGNLIWGFIQDEQHRLTLTRRAYEYDHHYGFTLVGRALRELRPADSRSRFLEAFHQLLHLCLAFFKEDDDATVIADGFPILNALKENHILLSEGMHNQFGDLPSTARMEMLMHQWLLARPEMREFLGGRIMVAYPEPWMDRVDTMKKLQGWTDVTSIHFRELAVFGEQVLLGIRYGNWNDIDLPQSAANWARFWRPEIQGYVHAYRAATGVDLAAEPVDARMPALHLRERESGVRAVRLR